MTHDDLERQIHEALDAGDESTLDQYADFCGDNIYLDILRPLYVALIQYGPLSADAGIALDKLHTAIDRQRAAFMAGEASRRMREIESIQEERHDYRRAS